MITVALNGKPRELDGPLSLSDLLAALAINPEQVAVAVSGEVVPRSNWDEMRVDDGDTVEVVRAVGGGSVNR